MVSSQPLNDPRVLLIKFSPYVGNALLLCIKWRLRNGWRSVLHWILSLSRGYGLSRL
jgi:hypothetical protein